MRVQVPGVLASVHLAWAELVPAQEAAKAVAAALQAVQQGLDIDRSHAPTVLLKAEAHTAAAKVASKLGGGHEAEAAEQWVKACQTYRTFASQGSQQLKGAHSERIVVRYNFACALSNCGHIANALQVLEYLAQCGPEALRGAAEDEDLANLRSEAAFHKLLN